MAHNRTLTKIRNLIGTQATIRLVRQYGNRTLTLPQPDKITDFHQLTVTVGLASAKALAEEFVGECLNLPGEVNALLELRNDEIVRRFLGHSRTAEDGESIRSLARDYDMDRKNVQKVIDAAGHRDLRLSRSMTDD